MKNRILVVLFAFALLFMLPGCGGNVRNYSEIELESIQSSCKLATIKCVYSGVIEDKVEKEGLLGIKENRKIWFEYTGTAELGIKLTDVTMEVSQNKVIVAIPKATVLRAYLSNDGTWYQDSEDFFEKVMTGGVKFDNEKTTELKGKAEDLLTKSAMENDTGLKQAEERAKEFVTEYINRISKVSGKEYTIEWR